MIAFKKILVPTDYSAASEIALRYGHEFAVTFQATLHVCHVADDPILFASTTSDQYRAQFINDSDSKLMELIRSRIGELDNARVVTLCGSAASELIDYAKQEDIDLVVMGSHGRSAMASMLLGNVAEHVVRHSPCPVMTVRSPEHDFMQP